MTIKELMEKYKNEDGTIDFEKAEKEFQENVGKIVSSTKKELSDKHEKTIEELSLKTKDIDEDNSKIKELEEHIQKIARQTEIDSFTKKATEFGVDSKLIDAFVESGSKLDKIDLEKFKKEEVKKIDKDQGAAVNEDNDKSVVEAQTKSLLDLIR